MPVAQTIQPQENNAHEGGHGLVCAAKKLPSAYHELDAPLTREQAIDELLTVHDKEEARRQACLARFRIAILTLVPVGFLIAGISSYFSAFPTRMVSRDAAGAVGKVSLLFITAANLLSAWNMSGWRKGSPLPMSFTALFSDTKREDFTPYFSSPIQQNVITAMLTYPDDPRIAEALCRALDYYRKDTNLLYLRLARLLPLLPSDGSALSETARQNLFNVSKRIVEYDAGNEKEQTLPVLQAAAKEYFRRTGEPPPRPKRKWFNAKQAAPQNTKENG